MENINLDEKILTNEEEEKLRRKIVSEAIRKNRERNRQIFCGD